MGRNITTQRMEPLTTENLTEDLSRSLLPVTVLITVQIILGIVGNILILIVYYKWYKMCNFRCFVLSMACIDLLSSITTLPGEVYSQSNWYNYENDTICKVKSFFNVFTVWSAGLLLLLLAYDRNRKICHTLSWQLPNHLAKRLSIVSVVISFIMSSPTAVLWGIQKYEFTQNNTTIIVSICEKDGTYADGNAPFIFIICGLVIPMALIMLVTVVFNVCTGRKLLVGTASYGVNKIINGCTGINTICEEDTCQNSSFDTMSDSDDVVISSRPSRRYSFPASRSTLRREQFDENNSVRNQATVKHELHDIPECEGEHITYSTIEKVTFITRFKHKKHHSQSDADIRTPTRARQLEIWRRRVLRHKMHSRRRKTMIMLTLSTVFIITTTMYLVLICFVANNVGVLKQLTNSEKVVFFLFWRLYFVNSLINPVLYGCMDERFRKGVRRLFHFKRASFSAKTFV